MSAVIPNHKLIETVVQQMPTWGAEMLYIEDQFLDVELDHVDDKSMTFVAKDIYGGMLAIACVSLHLIETKDTVSAMYEFVMDEVLATLECSYLRGGRAIHLA